MASLAETNNDAVEFFATGNYIESLARLQLALQSLRVRFAVEPHSRSNVAGSKRSLLIQSVPLQREHALEKDNCNGITFFDRAFLISTGGCNAGIQMDGEHSDAGTHHTQMCALVLYNIGVSHHLEGLVTGSKASLERAFDVYGMALQFLQMELSYSPLRIHGSLLLVSMALMNNIAHIQSSCFNYGETAHCVQWLRKAAAHLDSSFLKDADYMFFFVRYYVIPSNQISTSAAA